MAQLHVRLVDEDGTMPVGNVTATRWTRYGILAPDNPNPGSGRSVGWTSADAADADLALRLFDVLGRPSDGEAGRRRVRLVADLLDTWRTAGRPPATLAVVAGCAFLLDDPADVPGLLASGQPVVAVPCSA